MSITLESFGETNLQAIEYLLAQSVKGMHFLFDKHQIKVAFTQPTNGIVVFEQEDRNKIQHLFAGLIEKTTFIDKQNYFNALGDEDREVLIKAYFHIVENTIKNSLKITH